MRFTVHVVDESGKPISAAHASIMFNQDAVSLGKNIELKEITDDNGNFTGEGYSEYGLPVFRQLLSKDGYYNSGVMLPNFANPVDGKWQPWNGVYTTIMRRIGNPIPLYARRIEVQIPSNTQPCGFDLLEADWVAPFGKGKISDFVVTITNLQYRNSNDFDVAAKVSFSNADDGIQEIQLPKEFTNSVFKWPRLAPENGYQSKFDAHHLWLNLPTGSGKLIETSNESQAYFFRVRTSIQNGKILSALYGKIQGGIFIGVNDAKACAIGFSYYLNPTSLDRNLEFRSNLFKDLPPLEEINAP